MGKKFAVFLIFTIAFNLTFFSLQNFEFFTKTNSLDYKKGIFCLIDPPTQEWNSTWGGTGWDFGDGVVVADNGDIYCIGQFHNVSTDHYDLALLKFFPNGVRAWNITWGGPFLDRGADIIIDPNGSLFCVGVSSSSFDAKDDSIALIKFFPNGTCAWNVTWNGGGMTRGFGLAQGASGAIYCVGMVNRSGPEGYNLALVKFFSNGTRDWNVTWGGTGFEFGSDIAIDSTESVICLGSTDSYGNGLTDFFLAKFYSNGSRAWNTTWGGGAVDYSRELALDPSGSIYCSGSTESFGAGAGDCALVKFYPNGTRDWNITWGGVSYESADAIVIDASGMIYCAGTNQTSGDILLLKFYPNGNCTWNITWANPGGDTVEGLALSSAGSLYCTGSNDYSSSDDILLIKFSYSLETPSLSPISAIPSLSGIVHLNWTNISRATVYYLYRSTSKITTPDGLLPIACVNETYYTDYLAVNGIYYYAVVAGNIDGNSSLSNTDYVTVSIPPSPSSPSLLWTRTFGSVYDDISYGLAIDATGAVYSAGYIVVSPFDADLVLLKFYSNGTRAWNVTWGGSQFDNAEAVALDSEGAIYCTGGTTSFGDSSGDLALIKFHPNGTLAWNVTWGGPNADVGYGITIDPEQSIICGGSTSIPGNIRDFALVKFYHNGTLAWNVTWGGAQYDSCEAVATDNTGAIYCTGVTESYGAGGGDVALVKFYPNGTRAWNVTWGGASWDSAQGVAIDECGNIYCMGNTNSFGMGGSDISLIKFFPNGTRDWNVTWGGVGTEYGEGFTLDVTGAIYCTGSTDSYGAGTEDLVLVKFLPNGSCAWNTLWGGAGSDGAFGVVTDESGSFYCTGYTTSIGEGSYDLALVKFKLDLPEAPILDPILPNPNENGTIELNWNDVSNTTEYFIYRETSNITSICGLTPIASSIQSNYTDVITSNGVYYYAIVASNLQGSSSVSNCNSIEVLIPAPTANSPPNMNLPYGSSSIIYWKLHSEFGGGFFQVLLNGTPYLSWSPWGSDTYLMIPIQFQLGIGYWNYTIQFYDNLNQWGIPDTVIVNIYDLQTPSCTAPPAASYSADSSDKFIDWILYDNVEGGYYRVLLNGGTYISWTQWSNGMNIRVKIAFDRGIGTWNYTLQFNDSAGNSGGSHSVMITITAAESSDDLFLPISILIAGIAIASSIVFHVFFSKRLRSEPLPPAKSVPPSKGTSNKKQAVQDGTSQNQQKRRSH